MEGGPEGIHPIEMRMGERLVCLAGGGGGGGGGAGHSLSLQKTHFE